MTIGLVHFNHLTSDSLTKWPDMRTSSWEPNYGDMLVCAAIVRQLNAADGLRIGFGDWLDDKVDRAIIRGSTYLHDYFDFAEANRTLDSIDAPLAIVGLGAQNPTADVTYLDDNSGARDFIARLNEKSKSISVRGAFTAAVVERLGGQNIRVTGCPSMFYTLSCPVISVPEMFSRPERSVGVSIHSGLSNSIFCRSPREARILHGRAIAWAMENAANVSIFEQGVLREYDICDRDLAFGERRAAAEEVLGRINAQEEISPERMMAHMVSVKSIEEWLAKARDLDAIIGFRFHGNMVALLQGRPCLYYVYDSRITEFCQLYGLPHQDVAEPWRDPVQTVVNHDWDTANRRIAECFEELVSFYVENGFDMSELKV
ncbi:MAG: polysaccharide pyruvyl transferase family protein [Pseudomonadota bacterium]